MRSVEVRAFFGSNAGSSTATASKFYSFSVQASACTGGCWRGSDSGVLAPKCIIELQQLTLPAEHVQQKLQISPEAATAATSMIGL
jgi:hypothetical protein